MLRILISGGSGYLGSSLARKLINDGNEVHLLLRPQSKLFRLNDINSNFRVGRCGTDSEIRQFVREAAPDIIIHTACVYGRNEESIIEVFDSNIRFGVLVLQEAVSLNKSVVFFNAGTVLSKETNSYALAKNQFVFWGKFFSEQNKKIKFINVRLQHIYGPGDDLTKFATRVLHACYKNEEYIKLTLGEQERDFVYIDDVVNAYCALIKNQEKLDGFAEVDLGSGVAVTIRSFVERVKMVTSADTRLQFGEVPYRDYELMYCKANITKLIGFGWKPLYGIDEGLKKMLLAEFDSK